MIRAAARLCAAVLAAGGGVSQAAGVKPPPAPEVAPVDVVGVSPLGGALSPDKIAAPVQTAGAESIARSHALDLSAFMARELRGVYVNDMQGNPLQPDLNYRGYTASPLLGTPQGLSVYVDGVRLNQPFADVVSWDLIPKAAIADITLIPGSNPLFGLNTLGGAVAIRTKDGRTAPGGGGELSAGSYGRRTGEVEVGGVAGDFDGYATVSAFREDGWRDASPSNATQAFAKLGWRNAATRVAFSGAYGRSDLAGNGLQDQRLLTADRASVYTQPDITQNVSELGALSFQHDAGSGLNLSGNAYYRQIRSRTYNGDLNDESLTESVYQPSVAERAALTAAGYTGVPTAGESAANTAFPKFRCIANALLNTEPGEKCNGLINRTATRQHEAGAGLQATYDSTLNGLGNQLTAGVAYRESRVGFTQSTQYGYLTPDRGVVGVSGAGAFADGSQASENALDARVDLTGRTRTASLFASNTLDVTPELAVTVSGRFDADLLSTRDRITPGGGPGSLDGRHSFNRLAPAVGLTWAATPSATAYAGVSAGGRSPSVIELGCADPENPCRLPNALAGDPPLKPVRTATTEVGVRGRTGVWRWNAGLFRGENHDDILFVANDVSGFGHFRNFGRTRREGAELGLSGRLGAVSLSAGYTWLRATYRSPQTVRGTGNSANDARPGLDGDIEIQPGDRIPLTPAHQLKAQADWGVSETLRVSADVQAQSGVWARGNENNAHQPDGVFYLGPGRTKGYAVLNLGADWRPAAGLKLFAQITNVTNATYSTAAQLGATGFTDAGAYIARPFAGPIVNGERPVRNVTFFAPGAPRMVTVGLRWTFGP